MFDKLENQWHILPSWTLEKPKEGLIVEQKLQLDVHEPMNLKNGLCLDICTDSINDARENWKTLTIFMDFSIFIDFIYIWVL